MWICHIGLCTCVLKLLWLLGYMPVTAGKESVPNGKGPKGEILSPDTPSHLPLTSNSKGVLPQAERVPNTGLLPQQTKYLPPVLQQIKGQGLNAPLQQGKYPNSMVPQPAPKPFMQGPCFYKPSKAQGSFFFTGASGTKCSCSSNEESNENKSR